MQKTILLVEDTVGLAFVYRTALSAAGYNVTVVHTGEKALAALSTSPPPDLVVMDVALPDMQGWDLLEIIRHSDRWKKIPVVMATGWSDFEMDCPVDDRPVVLRKPFELCELCSAVEQGLRDAAVAGHA